MPTTSNAHPHTNVLAKEFNPLISKAIAKMVELATWWYTDSAWWTCRPGDILITVISAWWTCRPGGILIVHGGPAYLVVYILITVISAWWTCRPGGISAWWTCRPGGILFLLLITACTYI